MASGQLQYTQAQTGKGDARENMFRCRAYTTGIQALKMCAVIHAQNETHCRYPPCFCAGPRSVAEILVVDRKIRGMRKCHNTVKYHGTGVYKIIILLWHCHGHDLVILTRNLGTGNGQDPGCRFILSVAYRVCLGSHCHCTYTYNINNCYWDARSTRYNIIESVLRAAISHDHDYYYYYTMSYITSAPSPPPSMLTPWCPLALQSSSRAYEEWLALSVP